MSAERINYNYSIEGNTVRRMETAPDYDRYREWEVPDSGRQVERKKRKDPKQQSMDLVSVLILTASLVATFIVCISYLQVQSNQLQTEKSIVRMENEILELKDRNAAALERNDKNVDLNYVYQVATTKLGMVHPEKNQVISYKSTKSAYVRQYDDIKDSGSSKNTESNTDK